MKSIYIIQTYKQCGNSHNGLLPSKEYLFSSEVFARDWAKAEGYEVVTMAHNEKEVELSSRELVY